MRTIRKEKAKIKELLPSGARPFDVIALGENSIDLMAVVPDWPAPDQKQRLDRFEMLAGGQVATTAIGCARLGLRTRYVGAVGDDAWGEMVRAALAADGVEATLLVRHGAPTRCAIALVDRRSGARTILEHRDPSLGFAPTEIDPAVIASGRVLMLDSTDPEAGAIAAGFAAAAGMAVVVDAEGDASGLDRLLASADVIVTSAEFPQAHTGAADFNQALAELDRRYSPGLLIATRGAEGAVARWQGRELRVPARVIEAVDTTGAGDAFRAGLVASWLTLGHDAPVEELMRRANAAAALNCLRLGALAGLPTLAELEQWL